jgi:hypothetical protein
MTKILNFYLHLHAFLNGIGIPLATRVILAHLNALAKTVSKSGTVIYGSGVAVPNDIASEGSSWLVICFCAFGQF